METFLKASLFLLTASLFHLPSLAYEGLYKDGDVIIGSLLTARHKNSDDTCGALKPQGLAYVEAMLYAIDSINKDDKLLPNKTLGYDIIDSCDSPSLANSLAFEFVSRNKATSLKYKVNATADTFERFFGVLRKPIAAVIGTGDSSSSVVVASMLKIGKIPQVSPFATSEELSLPYFKTFFRPVPPDGQQAKALADVIDYFEWKYVYVIGVDTSYGRYGVMALEREGLERGTFCISQISYFPPSGYQKKMKTIVSKIKQASNIKVVVLWGGPTTSLHFIEEAFNQGVNGRTWLAPEGWSEATPLFKNKYMQIIGGFVGTKLRNYNLDGYIKHLMELNYSSPRVRNHTWWKEYWMLQKNCQSPLACDFMNFNINMQRYEDMYTAYIAYVIDAVYVIAHALDAIYRCDDKQSCPKIEPYINTKDVLRYMANVTFEGVTGRVEFDQNGDSISSAAYDIVNLHNGDTGPRLKIVGNWDRGEKKRLKIRNESMYWNNGSKKVPVSICIQPCKPGYMQTKTVACCWKCIRCPIGFISQVYSSHNCTECPVDKMPDDDRKQCIDLPEVNVSFHDTQSIVLLTVAGIEATLVIFVFTVGFKYRNTPIVKSSNRELSALFLFGIVIGMIAGIILLARPSTLICYVNNPLHGLYYSLCLSILIVKTSRLIRVFEFSFVSSRINQFCAAKNAQFLILFILNAITVIIVTIWHVMDPPYVNVTIERLKSKHLGCSDHKGVIGIALQTALYAYQLGLSVFCAYYAFKARNLPANFSEARYIAFAMYMQLLCTICYGTLQNSIEGNFLTTFSSAIVIISSLGFLVCMFLPKVYVILKYPEKNTTEYVKALVANHSLQRTFSQVNVNGTAKIKTTADRLKSQREVFNSSFSTLSTTEGRVDDSMKKKSASFHNIVEEMMGPRKNEIDLCNGNVGFKQEKHHEEKTSVGVAAQNKSIDDNQENNIIVPDTVVMEKSTGIGPSKYTHIVGKPESLTRSGSIIPGAVTMGINVNSAGSCNMTDIILEEESQYDLTNKNSCDLTIQNGRNKNVWQLNKNPKWRTKKENSLNEFQSINIVSDRPQVLELGLPMEGEDIETRL